MSVGERCSLVWNPESYRLYNMVFTEGFHPPSFAAGLVSCPSTICSHETSACLQWLLWRRLESWPCPYPLSLRHILACTSGHYRTTISSRLSHKPRHTPHTTHHTPSASQPAACSRGVSPQGSWTLFTWTPRWPSKGRNSALQTHADQESPEALKIQRSRICC